MGPYPVISWIAHLEKKRANSYISLREKQEQEQKGKICKYKRFAAMEFSDSKMSYESDYFLMWLFFNINTLNIVMCGFRCSSRRIGIPLSCNIFIWFILSKRRNGSTYHLAK